MSFCLYLTRKPQDLLWNDVKSTQGHSCIIDIYNRLGHKPAVDNTAGRLVSFFPHPLPYHSKPLPLRNYWHSGCIFWWIMIPACSYIWLLFVYVMTYLSTPPSERTRAGVNAADVISVEHPHLLIDVDKARHHLRLVGQSQSLKLLW